MTLKELCHKKVKEGREDEVIKLYSKNNEIIAWGTYEELLVGILGYHFLKCNVLERDYAIIRNAVTIDCEVKFNV